MSVSELIQVLQKFMEEDKGGFVVFDEGYMNEIVEENITVDVEKSRIYL